jgi:hypothetical protein
MEVILIDYRHQSWTNDSFLGHAYEPVSTSRDRKRSWNPRLECLRELETQIATQRLQWFEMIKFDLCKLRY